MIKQASGVVPHTPRRRSRGPSDLSSCTHPSLQSAGTSTSPFTPPPTSTNPLNENSIKSKAPSTTRILVHNIRGFPIHPSHPKNDKLREFINATQTDILAMTETNLDWRNLSYQTRIGPRTAEWFEARHLSIGHNTTENLKHTKQPGGVALLSLNRLVYRISDHGNDPWGLGRWSWTRYRGKGNRYLRVVVCYRPVPNKTGQLSVYRQHSRFFHSQNITMCPRSLFLTHLANEIKQWQQQQDTLVIMGDWNDDTSSTEWRKFWREHNLWCPLQTSDRESTPTFSRGTAQLDNLYVSPSLRHSAVGIIPIDQTFEGADHAAIWLDLENSNIGFEDLPTSGPSSRRLKNCDPRIRNRYNQLYEQFCIDHNLFDRATRLAARIASGCPLTPSDQDEFEAIDSTRVKGMQIAERNCRKLCTGKIPWSPQLAFCRHRIDAWSALVKVRQGRFMSSRYLRRLFHKANLPRIPNASLDEAKAKVHELYQEYRQLKRMAATLRESYLERLSHAQATDEGKDKSKILKLLRTREAQRAVFRQIRHIVHPARHGRGLTMVVDTNGKECTTKEDIERACLEENKQRFHQANNTPLFSEPVYSLLGPMGFGPASSTVLSGNLSEGHLPSHLHPIFQSLQSCSPDTSLNLEMSPEDYAAIWKHSKESTSSSSHDRLHFGHYIALSKVPLLCEFHTCLVNITIKSGYSPRRWRTGINVMLEKKPGDTRVTNLRTILLYDAEFNAVLKWLGKVIMERAETLHALAPEQYGSRKGHSAITHCLNMQLTYDVVRQAKIPAAICSNDAKACYDRIIHAFASLAIQRLGIPIGPIQVMFGTIQQLKHFIRTAHGDSTRFFEGQLTGLPLHGVGQGNGAGPQIWAAVSSPLFDLVRNHGLGTHLQSAISNTTTHFIGFGFVDDVDLVATTNTKQLNSNDTISLLQQTVDLWELGLRTSGGALSAAKSRWTLIDFKWDNGSWAYKSSKEQPATLTMQDVSGQRVSLTRLEAWQAERALGLRLAPSGTMQHEFAYRLELAQKWADQIRTTKVSKITQWINLRTVLYKRLEYPLMATTFTRAECDELMKPVFKVALSSLGIHSKFPRAMLYGHNKHHGLAIPHLYDAQGYLHLSALLHHGGTNNITGNLLQSSYELLQLEVGLPGEILHRTHAQWSYIATSTWLTETWKYASSINLQITTNLPSLKGLCEGDQFLMDVLWNKGYRGQDLLILNRCRLWLQILTVAELTDGTGTRLIPKLLRHRNPNPLRPSLCWPHQGPLPPSAWTLWETAVKSAFSTGNLNQLKTPLGPWCIEPMWVWDPVHSRLYQSVKHEWLVWHTQRPTRPLGTTFSSTSTVVKKTPQPCLFARVLETSFSEITYWGARPYTPSLPSTRREDFYTSALKLDCASWALRNLTTPDNGRGVADAIKAGQCIAVSDGSFKDGMGTAAWKILGTSTNTWISGSTWVPGPTESQSSFRSELAGMFSIALLVSFLCEYYHISEGKITIGCDGLGPLHRCFVASWDPKPATVNYDFIKAIRHLARQSGIQWNWIHIKGHQDDTTPVQDLDLWASLNIAMDTQAKHTWEQRSTTNPEPFHTSLPGEGWSLWQAGCKFTDWKRVTFDGIVQTQYSQSFWSSKHKLGDLMNTIDWDIIHRLRIRRPILHRIWMTKCVTEWLPTAHNMEKWQLWQSSQCPLCKGATETFAHLFYCTSPLITSLRKNHCDQLLTQLSNAYLPPLWTILVLSAISPTEAPHSILSTNTFQAYQEQQLIGLHWTAFGFLSLAWRRLFQRQQTIGVLGPTSVNKWLDIILSSHWTTAWDIWSLRNSMVQQAGHHLDQSQLRAQVTARYSQGLRSLPFTAVYLFRENIDQLLNRPDHYLRAWLQSVKAAEHIS